MTTLRGNRTELTRSTTAIIGQVCIGSVVGVPLGAMGLCQLQSAVLVRGPNPSLDVLGDGDGLQMGRIDASMIAAEMIERKSLGDRTDGNSVGVSMRQHLVGMSVGKDAITGFTTEGSPLPAFIRSAFIDFTPESNINRLAMRHNSTILSKRYTAMIPQAKGRDN